MDREMWAILTKPAIFTELWVWFVHLCLNKVWHFGELWIFMLVFSTDGFNNSSLSLTAVARSQQRCSTNFEKVQLLGSHFYWSFLYCIIKLITIAQRGTKTCTRITVNILIFKAWHQFICIYLHIMYLFHTVVQW